MNPSELMIDINPSNRCYSDYKNFITMQPDELIHFQNNYYQELKTLQHELDQLLSDLKKSKLYHSRNSRSPFMIKQAV